MPRLRVLHLINDLGKGGAERFLIDLSSALQERDVDVRIGTLYDNNKYEWLTRDLVIEPLGFAGFSPRRRNECPGYESLLTRFKPDVVHTHLFLAEFLSSYYVSRRIAYVCHGHSNMVQFEPSWLALWDSRRRTELFEREWLVWRKYRRVQTTFVGISADTADYYRRVLPRFMQHDVELVPNGFRYDRFYRAGRNQPLPGEPLHLINVGSFVRGKNQAFLVRVALALRNSGVQCVFHLVGDGPCRRTVEAMVSEAGLTESFEFHGLVDAVEDELAGSHIYVHAARSEAFGLVLLEAMAAGLPCVALDGGGNRDLFENGRNGFLIDAEDAQVFAARILDLARDPVLYASVSARAQAFAKSFDIGRNAARFIALYQSRLARSMPA